MIVINIFNVHEHIDSAIKWCKENIPEDNWKTVSLPPNDVIGYSKVILCGHINYYLLPWFHENYRTDLFLCGFGFKNTQDATIFKLRWGG